MTDLVSGVLFLAPGFLALKLFYLLGAQRPRSEWEWTTWSIIASLPISAIAIMLRSLVAVPRSTPDPVEITLAILVGVVLGSAASAVWQIVRGSSAKWAGRLRRAFGSSAWDEALEDVQRERRQVELVLDDGKRYVGTIGYGGREDNKAEGWVYLVHPEVYDEAAKRHRPAKGTHGYLVHRDQIKRLRVLLKRDELAPGAIAGGTEPSAVESEVTPGSCTPQEYADDAES